VLDCEVETALLEGDALDTTLELPALYPASEEELALGEIVLDG